MPPASIGKKKEGCFQCSRRRIICDKTEPSCVKCSRKGIECSGLGRIRFAEGVARRGRLKDCKVPNAGGDESHIELPTATAFQSIRWPDDKKREGRRESDVLQMRTTSKPSSPIVERPQLDSNADLAMLSPGLQDRDQEEEVELEDLGREYASVNAYSRQLSIRPWIAPIDPKMRMLFSYCMF